MTHASPTAVRSRLLGVLGRVSMYRAVLNALAILAVLALVLSLFGLVVPGPGELLASALVLVASCVLVNAAAQLLLRLPVRHESALITAGILLFVLRPELDPAGLAWLAAAGAVAMASKYLLVWRGRHVLNPAAVGASVVTLLAVLLPDAGVGASAWWVGSPVLAVPVVLLGLLVLVRTERLAVAGLFLGVAAVVALTRTVVQGQAAGVPLDLGTDLSFVLLYSPFLFLGAFMLSEPLTLPPRRGQQLVVAAVVGVLAGWPIPLGGGFTLGQERALLVGNLVAFAWALHRARRLRLDSAEMITPTVRELRFTASGPVRFLPGQYLELQVPHRRPDIRGSRRPFSIVSAPSDLPEVRVAYRVPPEGERVSSLKTALAGAEPGTPLTATGVWGDFVLPRHPGAPVLLVAGGIGVTPFVSSLREDAARGVRRDVVLVYVASSAAELAFRDELSALGVRTVVFCREGGPALPQGWEWAGAVRADAETLGRAVPDLGRRHAFVSGPPALIAALAPALRRARSLRSDAFAGY